MELSYSQKVARNFLLMGYILLIPAGLSLIYPVFFVIGGLMEHSAGMVGIGLLPILIAAVGVILLCGYVKHYKGKLNEKYVCKMWVGTAIYNFLLLSPWLFYAVKNLYSTDVFFEHGDSSEVILTALSVFGYGTVIYFSVKAYLLEKRVKLQ